MTDREQTANREAGEILPLEPIDCREMQTAELKILDSFLDICEKHRLRYYLNAGTLLGAVRHQGFIPWDDDIDVCMPRPDYERFLETAAKELAGRLRLHWYGNQEKDEHLQYSCQIQDTGLPLVQKIAQQDKETYAWIDVFPLDGMPANPVKRKIHALRLLYLRAKLQASARTSAGFRLSTTWPSSWASASCFSLSFSVSSNRSKFAFRSCNCAA